MSTSKAELLTQVWTLLQLVCGASGVVFAFGPLAGFLYAVSALVWWLVYVTEDEEA